jgi:hypothetical protein
MQDMQLGKKYYDNSDEIEHFVGSSQESRITWSTWLATGFRTTGRAGAHGFPSPPNVHEALASDW